MIANVLKGVQPRPRRCLLYGVPGIGKSTWAAKSPRPIFVPTEDGLSDIDCEKFPVAETFADVQKHINTLQTEEHDYKTAVIDSADWTEKLIHAAICEKRGINSIEDIGYGKGYVYAGPYLAELLNQLDRLIRERRMMVVWLAHSKVEPWNDPDGSSFDRHVPRMHKTFSALLTEWCDEVFCAYYRVIKKSEDLGFNRRRDVAIGDAERVIATSGAKSTAIAKNRLHDHGLPCEIPLDFSEYLKHFPGKKGTK